MPASPLLRWTVDSQGGPTRVALLGTINEDSDFAELLSELHAVRAGAGAAPSVVLDLAGVQNISPPGVREWLQFVAALHAKVGTFDLVRCSVAVVHQMNSTWNFRGAGKVRSIYAPYYCPPCEADRTRLVDVDAHGQPAAAADAPCPTCGAPMESSLAHTLLLHLPKVNTP